MEKNAIYLERTETGVPGIPLDSLRGRTVVAGSYGAGKTTTIRKILWEAYRCRRLPFVVLEWGQGEYARLAERIPGLRVYSTVPGAGPGRLPFRFNPLQPEPGVRIGEHAAAAAQILAGAAGGDRPVSFYREMLLQQYRQAGWASTQKACQDPACPFPTLWDVLRRLDGELQRGGGPYPAGFRPETPDRQTLRRDLLAVLAIEWEHPYEGRPMQYFEAAGTLSAGDLLSGPAVLELGAFYGKAADFLLGILRFRFQCALARLPEAERLERLLVLEDADWHVKKPSPGEAGERREETWEREQEACRRSGTGWIFSVEHPAEFPASFWEGTEVRIAHALISGRDRAALEPVLGRPALACRTSQDMQPGRCLVSLPGEETRLLRVSG